MGIEQQEARGRILKTVTVNADPAKMECSLFKASGHAEPKAIVSGALLKPEDQPQVLFDHGEYRSGSHSRIK